MEPANLDPYETDGDAYPTIPFCDECKEPLPQPVVEERGDGNTELVTYCFCGAVYYD